MLEEGDLRRDLAGESAESPPRGEDAVTRHPEGDRVPSARSAHGARRGGSSHPPREGSVGRGPARRDLRDRAPDRPVELGSALERDLRGALHRFARLVPTEFVEEGPERSGVGGVGRPTLAGEGAGGRVGIPVEVDPHDPVVAREESDADEPTGEFEVSRMEPEHGTAPPRTGAVRRPSV